LIDLLIGCTEVLDANVKWATATETFVNSDVISEGPENQW